MSQLIADGVMHYLYAKWQYTIDQRYMSEDYRAMFNAEVEANGFTSGQKSFIITGPFSNNNAVATYTCLTRGEYSAGYVDAVSLVRRLNGEYVPGWSEEDDHKLHASEVLVVVELFTEDYIDAMTARDKMNLIWFIVRRIEMGTVLVLPMPVEVDLNILGEAFGDFLEKNFEVFNGTGTAKKSTGKKKKPAGRGRNRGDAAAGEHPK